MPTNFKEIVQRYAQKQVPIVDDILQPNPIFRTATFEPTTHGYRHVYEQLSGITGMQFVNLNDSYGTVNADYDLKKQDISKMAGRHEVHVDTAAEIGGSNSDSANGAAYINRKIPAIITGSLNNASKQIYYNMLEKFSVANGKAVSATANPTGNKYYSIYIVRWENGQFNGLFNSSGFGQVAGTSDLSMVKVTPLNGGSRYVSSGKSVLGWDMEMPFGFLTANKNNISSIHNIDSTASSLGAAFAKLLSRSVLDARPNTGGRTYMYMHPYMASMLGEFKDQIVRTTLSENGINRIIAVWDETEIITDWNLLAGTESPVAI